MRYYSVLPEAATFMGPESVVLDDTVHPPILSRLEIELDRPPDDDLLSVWPCFVVSPALKEALAAAGVTGCEFDKVSVKGSLNWKRSYPGQRPPSFVWLKITGAAGVDDFGNASECRLIVSEKALLVLQSHRLDDCEVERYDPNASDT